MKCTKCGRELGDSNVCLNCNIVIEDVPPVIDPVSGEPASSTERGSQPELIDLPDTEISPEPEKKTTRSKKNIPIDLELSEDRGDRWARREEEQNKKNKKKERGKSEGILLGFFTRLSLKQIIKAIFAIVLIVIGLIIIIKGRNKAPEIVPLPAEEWPTDSPTDYNWDERTDSVTNTLSPAPAPTYEPTWFWLDELDFFSSSAEGTVGAIHKPYSNYSTKDNLGNTHEHVLMPGAAKKNEQSYVLGGNYTNMTGVFYLRFDNRNTDYLVNFIVYGDGVKIWSCEGMTKGVRPVEFDIDLRGVEQMTIIISSDGYSDCVAIGEAILHKEVKESAPVAGGESTAVTESVPAPVTTPQPSATPVTTPKPSTAPVTTPKPSATPATQAPSAFSSLKVGDLVTLGHYEQDNNIGNGKEPVEWYVLAVEDDRALLFSRYVLDCLPYHSQALARGSKISWEDCTLRAWLNNDFLNAAFSEEEQKYIVESTLIDDVYGNEETQDKIFLLSSGEVGRYIFAKNNTAGVCVPTAYATAMGFEKEKFSIIQNAETVHLEEYEFLTRSHTVTGAGTCCIVGESMYSGYKEASEASGVRPAVWISMG